MLKVSPYVVRRFESHSPRRPCGSYENPLRLNSISLLNDSVRVLAARLLLMSGLQNYHKQGQKSSNSCSVVERFNKLGQDVFLLSLALLKHS
jgi:hypothetical protein